MIADLKVEVVSLFSLFSSRYFMCSISFYAYNFCFTTSSQLGYSTLLALMEFALQIKRRGSLCEFIFSKFIVLTSPFYIYNEGDFNVFATYNATSTASSQSPRGCEDRRYSFWLYPRSGLAAMFSGCKADISRLFFPLAAHFNSR